MGETIKLTAADGHEFEAYRAEPEGDAQGSPKGGIVVIQEIFGVNAHIREVCDGYARQGYLAIAPAIFDRFERGVDLGYTDDDKTIGRALKAKGNDNLDAVLADVKAAHDAAATAGKVGITGYCWGGVVVWAAACRLGFDAAVAYYGGGIIDLNAEEPTCPTILHFGEHDGSIPMADVDAISAAHPDVEVHVYDAGHGFNCDHRPEFDRESAEIALHITHDLFAEHVG
ncbi:MAG: dienelactone hydrolase family protein [Rhodospirillales bacterium]|nr:dienelactone hydrolase family protein [Rhodospirillales bacterium]